MELLSCWVILSYPVLRETITRTYPTNKILWRFVNIGMIETDAVTRGLWLSFVTKSSRNYAMPIL